MTEKKQQAQQIGQGSFPAPKQMEHPENDNSHSFSVNRPDDFGLRGMDSEDRKAEVKPNDVATMDNGRNDRNFLLGDFGNTPDGGLTNEQNANTNFDSGRNPTDPGNRGNPGSSNRADDEMKNGQLVRKESFVVQGSFLGNGGIRSDRFGNQGDSEIAPSARLSAPAKLAAFDAANYSLPHVQNEQENNQSATCAESPEVIEKPRTKTSRELTTWAIENFAVDPVQNSKNRWRIRLRCRKAGCQHSDHLHLLTVSFMADSAFRQISRSKRKYELWKKQILAENARALRKSN